jgi:hypothetical protein
MRTGPASFVYTCAEAVVIDTASNGTVAQEGYGCTYGSTAKKTLKVYKEGSFIIVLSGQFMDVTMKITTGSAPLKATPTSTPVSGSPAGRRGEYGDSGCPLKEKPFFEGVIQEMFLDRETVYSAHQPARDLIIDIQCVIGFCVDCRLVVDFRKKVTFGFETVSLLLPLRVQISLSCSFCCAFFWTDFFCHVPFSLYI